jgi:hypothetical protein
MWRQSIKPMAIAPSVKWWVESAQTRLQFADIAAKAGNFRGFGVFWRFLLRNKVVFSAAYRHFP